MVKKVIKSFFYLIKEKKLIPIPQVIYSEKILDGKTALITGGNGGIGYAIAEEFIKCGCKVIIAGTNEVTLQKCADSLGENCHCIRIDICNDDLNEKIKSAVKLFDDSRLDILVNSAGIANKVGFWDISAREYDNIMNVNAKGTFL